jgi:hypothetical protein
VKRHCSVCHLPGHTKASHKRRKNPPAFHGAKKDEPKKLTAKQKAKQYDQRWLFGDPLGVGGYEQHKLFDTRKKNPKRRRNLAAFTDSKGVIHPIRGSKDYQGWMAK